MADASSEEHAHGRRIGRCSRRYRRVVLKLSGESFAHAGERGIGMDEVVHIAQQTCQRGPARRRRSPSSSAAATSSAAPSSPPATPASTRPPPTTWACWPR